MAGSDDRSLTRRQVLQGGCAGLGLTLLRIRPAWAGGPEPDVRRGRVSGVVSWAGRAGPPPKLRLVGDCDYCLRSEELLQAPSGGLQNVVVSLEGLPRGKEPPTEVPVIAEDRCSFAPHVLTITAGCKVLLHNRDPVLNTFHAVEAATGRTLFNVGTPLLDQKVTKRIRTEGLIRLVCDVHPWESGYVFSFPHPHHTTTDAAGAFSLDGVPPGAHTLVLWHEKLGELRRGVEVAPRGHAELTVVYPVA